MEVEDVTYEEWLRASRFARFRFKYGLFVLIACWICLLLLIGFVWHYSYELSTHPATYMLEKLQSNYCYCYSGGYTYYINSTDTSYVNSYG